MNECRQQLMEEFQTGEIDYKTLKYIFEKLSEFSPKCKLDETTLQQIYQIMVEKAQPQPLTYQKVDEIIFELIVDDVPPQTIDIQEFLHLCLELNKDRKTPRKANKLSAVFVKDLSDRITRETGIKQSRLDSLLKLRDENDQIDLADISKHFGISFPQRQLTIETNNLASPQSDMSHGLSTQKNFSQMFTPGSSQVRGLLNLTYSKIDMLKKHTKKNPVAEKLIRDLLKIQQKIEQEFENQKANKPSANTEELEEAEQNINELSEEVRRYQEQVAQMIDDNENLSDQLNQISIENDSLVSRLDLLQKSQEDDNHRIGELEGIIRKKDQELRDLKQSEQKLSRENHHLQENNKQLLEMLDKIEEQQENQLEQIIHENDEFLHRQSENNLTIAKKQLVLIENENKQLSREILIYQEQLKSASDVAAKLEDQLMSCKRELAKYKKLFDDANEEIAVHRKSIARMSVMGLQSLKSNQMSARQSIAMGMSGLPSKITSKITSSIPQSNDEIAEESEESGSDEDSEKSEKSSRPKPQNSIMRQKDFLKLGDKENIIDLIQEERQKYDLQYQRMLSAEVSLVIKNGNDFQLKEKKILLLTDYQMILFDDLEEFNQHDSRLVGDIKKVIINQQNTKLLGFGFSFDANEIYLSCINRTDITVFLTDTFIMRKLPLFQQVKEVGRKQSLWQSSLQVLGKNPTPDPQPTTQSLFRMEYVQMLENKSWNKYYMILCNVGILVFDEPCETTTKMFIPILNNTVVIKNPQLDDGQIQQGLKVSSIVDFYLKFDSDYEQNEWMDKIKQVAKQF